MTSERYSALISVIMQECPNADEEEISKEFERYENEFLIPPEDALRSVLRKFQASSGIAVENNASTPPRVEKKVDRFSELQADDKNVTIEVSVISYTPRVQKVRGEDRQVAFGWIEDNPWGSSSEKERWDFKDWGLKNDSLIPGSIVRLEGVSVNEWDGIRTAMKKMMDFRIKRIVVLNRQQVISGVLSTGDIASCRMFRKRTGLLLKEISRRTATVA